MTLQPPRYTKTLLLAVPGMVLIWVLYKLVYPYPDFFFDSSMYVGMAQHPEMVTLWPPGYSWFLRIVHCITASHYVLVTVQYVLLQASVCWLAYSVFVVMRVPQWIVTLFAVSAVLNPVIWYFANLVSSDVLFTALALCWVALLVRMLHQARIWHLLLLVPLSGLLLQVRYQALYCPAITLGVLCIARFSLGYRLVTAVVLVLLTVIIIRNTIQTNERNFGVKHMFSAQSGWMLANNAMYMYPHIQLDTSTFGNARVAFMHGVVLRLLEQKGLLQKNYTPWQGPRFMLGGGVMRAYMIAVARQDSGKSFFWYYHRLARHWQLYGRQLILTHPLAYSRYYLLPNVALYFMPLMEQFEGYNTGSSNMAVNISHWFQLRDNKVACLWPEGAAYLMGWCRLLFLMGNIGLLAATGALFWKKGYLTLSREQLYCIRLLGMVLTTNAVFLIIAAPVMMRYQAFAFVLVWLLLLLLVQPCINLFSSRNRFALDE